MRFSVAALVIVLLATGCVSEPAQPAAPAAPVVVPGKPGEPASIVPPEQADQHRPHETPNDADVYYVTMMIPHHRQAKFMTDLVTTKSTDEQVRAIAGRIAVTQDAEITLMAGWLARYGKPVPGDEHAGHGEHDHAVTPGMASAAQLDALRAATGREFDTQFLTLMITHHQGALTMAEKQLSRGVEIKAQEMAQDVIIGQSAESERMRALLTKV